MAQREALRVRHNGPTGNGSPNRRLPGAGSGWRRSAGATARGRRPIWTKGAGPTRGAAQRLGRWQRTKGRRGVGSARRVLGRRRSRWMNSPHQLVHTRNLQRTSFAQIHRPLDIPTVTTSKALFSIRCIKTKRHVATRLEFGARGSKEPYRQVSLGSSGPQEGGSPRPESLFWQFVRTACSHAREGAARGARALRLDDMS